MALCFESPDDDNPSLMSNPTILSKDGGLLIVQKHDNDTYRYIHNQICSLFISPVSLTLPYEIQQINTLHLPPARVRSDSQASKDGGEVPAGGVVERRQE
jgi:hypothetical protein